MAQAFLFVCTECGFSVEAWSDGNPYYIDPNGQKQYAYHPNHDLLALCIGNDSPHLCLECGHEFNVDSREPVNACPKCGENHFQDTFELEGEPCPQCKQGKFGRDPDWFAIS